MYNVYVRKSDSEWVHVNVGKALYTFAPKGAAA